MIEGEIVRRVGLEATMADGAVLVADAWHLAEGGPWPVLLQRLPYGRSVASTPVLPHPTWFARRGYAVVVQDCRGRGDSTGTFAPFVHEAADGAASIEWAARLPFSDGRVATYGFSYQGLAQLYAAATRPSSLRAIAPMMCCPDPYEGWTYEGGLLRWPFVCFWAAQLAGQDRGTGPIPFDTGAVPISGALGADPPPWFEEWLAHPRDDAYWAARRPDLDAIDVPAFTVMGWFDDFSSGTATLIDRLGAEAWCGPWAHMPWGTRHGGAELGQAASPAPLWDALMAFFDRTFGRDGAAAPAAPVRYFVVGDGWRQAASWPPPHTVRTMAGHSVTGNANSRSGDGVLLPAMAGIAPGRPTTIVAEPHVAHLGDPVGYQDDSPAHDRASPHGHLLTVHGRHRGMPDAPRSGDRALRCCRASSTGDAIWPRRRDGNFIKSRDGSMVARLSRGRARRHKPRPQGRARDRPSRHVDVRADDGSNDPCLLQKICGSKRTSR